jgi:hypothetical protein
MRTTIQLPDENRDILLSLARERGEKNVSRVVQEAVAFYLQERARPAPAPLAPLPPPPPAPPAPPAGRWQRVGEELDRTASANPGLLGMLRALVRSGIGRIKLLRA